VESLRAAFEIASFPPSNKEDAISRVAVTDIQIRNVQFAQQTKWFNI
jgi:hypothetical protein